LYVPLPRSGDQTLEIVVWFCNRGKERSGREAWQKPVTVANVMAMVESFRVRWRILIFLVSGLDSPETMPSLSGSGRKRQECQEIGISYSERRPENTSGRLIGGGRSPERTPLQMIFPSTGIFSGNSPPFDGPFSCGLSDSLGSWVFGSRSVATALIPSRA